MWGPLERPSGLGRYRASGDRSLPAARRERRGGVSLLRDRERSRTLEPALVRAERLAATPVVLSAARLGLLAPRGEPGAGALPAAVTSFQAARACPRWGDGFETRRADPVARAEARGAG